MNRYESEQYDRYYERRREASNRLDIDRPQWYVDAKSKFDNEKDYETKKRYEKELQDKVKKHLDESVS
jgi:hypothetical protein